MNQVNVVFLALKEVSHPIIVGILWLIAATSLSKCKPADAPQAEAAYQAALLACVDKSETLDESRACRAKVNESWGLCGPKPVVELCP